MGRLRLAAQQDDDTQAEDTVAALGDMCSVRVNAAGRFEVLGPNGEKLAEATDGDIASAIAAAKNMQIATAEQDETEAIAEAAMDGVTINAAVVEPCEDCPDVEIAPIPVKPPLEWFENPMLDELTPITVTSDGQVYGYAAGWGTCHIGNPRGAGVCVEPPRSLTGYALFHLGGVETAEGDVLAVGQITLDTGHAPLGASARTAAAHYDDTGTVVADVRAGEDEHGIWFAGALRPDLTDKVRRKLLGAKISGDWRRGELVGMLGVNVPGFPIPRTKARLLASSGGQEQVMSLVAAGIVGERSEPISERDLEIRVAVLAERAERGIDGLFDMAER